MTTTTTHGAWDGFSLSGCMRGDERVGERRGQRERADRERPVGAEHREAGEESGPRPDGAADQSVRRAGVVEVAGQPDEAVADQRHPDQADQEHQRDRLPNGADQALTVSRHRQGRPDEGDRQRQRHPERQLPPRDLVDLVRRAWPGVLVVIDISFVRVGSVSNSRPAAVPWWFRPAAGRRTWRSRSGGPRRGPRSPRGSAVRAATGDVSRALITDSLVGRQHRRRRARPSTGPSGISAGRSSPGSMPRSALPRSDAAAR